MRANLLVGSPRRFVEEADSESSMMHLNMIPGWWAGPPSILGNEAFCDNAATDP